MAFTPSEAAGLVPLEVGTGSGVLSANELAPLLLVIDGEDMDELLTGLAKSNTGPVAILETGGDATGGLGGETITGVVFWAGILGACPEVSKELFGTCSVGVLVFTELKSKISSVTALFKIVAGSAELNCSGFGWATAGVAGLYTETSSKEVLAGLPAKVSLVEISAGACGELAEPVEKLNTVSLLGNSLGVDACVGFEKSGSIHV
jgi:hypothetical protein